MGKQMGGKAVTKTRRIASARIHVERAIGRLKTSKFYKVWYHLNYMLWLTRQLSYVQHDVIWTQN